MKSILHTNQLLQLSGANFVEAVYRTLLLRAPEPEGLSVHLDLLLAGQTKASIITKISESVEAQRLRVPLEGLDELNAMSQHLELIHKARINLVSKFLPQGDIILDLGGANCPLYKMGYPHKFKKLYVIDLPPNARHDMYREIVIDPNCDGGEVIIKYGDMTELDFFGAKSVDFVWSGQSIEHVSLEAGAKMCNAAFKVLKKGGSFCLDTPNRKLTEIHLQDSGLNFIHPEHCLEYYPTQLRKVIQNAGFKIKQTLGICEMPNSLRTKKFCYEDFFSGNQVTTDVERGYIQFFHCVKP